MKEIFKCNPVYLVIKNLFNRDRKTLSTIGYHIILMLAPLLFITGLIFMFSVVGSFILWKLPEHYYFPFVTGGELQRMFDRILLGVGILISMSHPIKN